MTNSCLGSTRTVVRSVCVSAFTGTVKVVRGVETHFERTRLECHNIQLSDERHIGKVFENSPQEDRIFWRVNRTDTCSEDQCIDVGIVYVNNDESISSPWALLQRRFDCVQEHQLQGAQGVPRYAEFDLGTCIRDSKCFHD